jgi:TRAP-type C4-dicarboxylate transport system permease small subunit
MHEPTPKDSGHEDRLDRVLGLLCAVPLALIVAITFADVFARYLFASPIRGSVEMIEFAMALVIFTAMPLVTRHRGHVTVSLIDGVLRGRAILVRRLACDGLSALALGLVAWRLALHGADDFEAGTRTIVLEWLQAPLTWAMAVLAGVSALILLAQMAARLRDPRGARGAQGAAPTGARP